MADYIPPPAPASPVTQLQAGFPTLQPNSSGTATGTATETPFGATKKNPLGIELGDLQKRAEANAELGAATQEQGENAVNRAVMGTEQADAKLTAGAPDLKELHNFHDAWTKDFTERKERGRQMEERIQKAAQFHDHFTDKNIGDKIIAVIASAALGFGTGRPANVVADIEAADHAKQEAQLNSLMATAKMMGESDDRLRQVYSDAQTHMTLGRKLKFEQIAAEFEKQAAMATTVEKQTELKLSAAQFKKLANEEDLAYERSLRTRSSKSATSAVKPAAVQKRY